MKKNLKYVFDFGRYVKAVECKCCGSKEVPEGEIGLGYVCNKCGWEHDDIQEENPNRKGGMNKMSLNEAKEAYKKGEKVY